MLLNNLKILFLREISTLERELNLYPDDATVWKELPGLPNSTGTLILHLAGNLQHFIGATLGNTGYLRNREAEFSNRDIPRTKLKDELTNTTHAVNATFATLSENQLEEVYPLSINGVQLTTALTLLHLSNHLAYHLGQIDYHRRAVTGDKVSANAVVIAELAS
jgi:uncharacterized damage-inducible protein DinB